MQSCVTLLQSMQYESFDVFNNGLWLIRKNL